MSYVDNPVMNQTRFSQSGWGVWCLESCEPSQAFDLFPYLEWDNKFLTQIVLIHILQVIVDSIFKYLRPLDQPGGGPHLRLMASNPRDHFYSTPYG